MGGFAVEVLTSQRVMEIYPLVRQIVPGITLESWRRHAAVVLRDRSGNRGIALLRRAGQRFPCGMCAFHLDHDLRLGRTLTAEHGMVMTSFGTHEAFDALVQGVQDLAAERRCAVVRWLLPKAAVDPAELPRSALLWVPIADVGPLTPPDGAAPAR